MGPFARTLWDAGDAETRVMLGAAQHFIVPEAMTHLCHALGGETAEGVFDGRLPAEKVWVETSMDGGGPLGWFLNNDGDEVRVWYSAPPGRLSPLASYRRGADHFVLSPVWIGNPQIEATRKAATIALRLLDAMMILICEPRLVRHKQASRQQRRALKRDFGSYAEVTWGEAAWVVGSAVTRHGSGVESGGTKALHFARAHWRRSEHPTPMTEIRPGRPGLWIWVKGSWRGHPRNGVRLKRYKPEIGVESTDVVTLEAVHRMPLRIT